jgi:uncharacterized protein (TIGR02646 family)
MRPISRGIRPLDSQGLPKIFGEYQQARGDLIDRLGEYCSYCEMHLDASLAVEHVQPKSLYPKLELEWDNFLLACVNCNSTKKDKDINLGDCYWADTDNTFHAFIYSEDGLVQPNPFLAEEAKAKAQLTLELLGLHRHLINDARRSDRRQINRREKWLKAKTALGRLQIRNTPEMREQIVDTAKESGFWSVWMTVFKDEPDMLQRFIAEFPGTCRNCFDVEGKPMSRLGGNL